MKTMHDAYRSLEAQAGNYADPQVAWRIGRRRRVRQYSTGAILAALVVSSCTWAIMSVAGRTTEALVATPPSSSDTPPSSVPQLPNDAAVGPAAMIYTACQYSCPTYLVTKDGQRYLLGDQTLNPPGNLTLSPEAAGLANLMEIATSCVTSSPARLLRLNGQGLPNRRNA